MSRAAEHEPAPAAEAKFKYGRITRRRRKGGGEQTEGLYDSDVGPAYLRKGLNCVHTASLLADVPIRNLGRYLYTESGPLRKNEIEAVGFSSWSLQQHFVNASLGPNPQKRFRCTSISRKSKILQPVSMIRLELNVWFRVSGAFAKERRSRDVKRLMKRM
nr:uncharacterized protein LOC112289472 [Physcomitrium patens]|eukprot:XP_024390482.1 uncharacterized protein LOC112289472 [Physcomitrella patens]